MNKPEDIVIGGFFLKCIKGLSLSTHVLLSEGTIYEIQGENNGRYIVTDDTGKECHANKDRFASFYESTQTHS